MGMTCIILEMDTTVLASSLKANKIDRKRHGCLVRQSKDIMQYEFSSCSISNCNRCCNRVVDALVAYGGCMVSSDCELLMGKNPEFVCELASGDLPKCHA